MGFRRWLTLATITVVSAATFAGAGAVTGPPATATHSVAKAHAAVLKALDFSNPSSVQTYFRSIGIDPATVVYQSGVNNYAGPSCPGAGWSCVPADKPVLQMSSSSSGSNSFTCTPSSAGTSSPNKCVIVQSVVSGSNTAKCVESTTFDGVTQECNVTQTTTNGKNRSTVTQTATETSGLSQTETQIAFVTQANGTGDNILTLKQTISQTIGSGGPLQMQEAHQTATVSQYTSGSGDNDADVTQKQKQRESFSGTTAITQAQNTTGSSVSERNLLATIDQTSDGGGENEAELRQDLDQEQKAGAKTAGITQSQGYDEGGLDGTIDQDSTGSSDAEADQDEKQKQSGKTTGTPTQKQVGPVRCCSDQTGNPDNDFKISQEASQSSGSGATQTEDVEGECHSSGECEVKQEVKVQDTKTKNSCSGSDCSIGIFCEGTECFTSSGTD
jgi:hypothetical protein